MNRYFFKKVGLSFIRAFVPVFVLGILPVWDSIVAADWDAGKAAGLAAISAAVTAGIRAGQALFTSLETDSANQ